MVRVFGALSVAATLGFGTLPAFAQTTPTTTGGCSTIDFQLANPSPGTRVEVGNNIIQGVAMATNAPGGANGIDRVDFFLGSRDEGGLNVGSAVPGMTAGPFGPGSFSATVSFPDNNTGGNDLVAYAHSAVTGQQSVISVPISIGEDTSKAFVTVPTDVQTMCIGSAAGTASPGITPVSPTTSATTPASTTTTTTTTTATTPSTQSIMIEVGNPSPGDTIKAGAYVMVGRAFDRNATSGSGIDRIEIFLDNRDQGGLFLGQAAMVNNNMWSATVNLPTNNTGLHTLTIYAHSAVSNAESSVEVPVTVTN